MPTSSKRCVSHVSGFGEPGAHPPFLQFKVNTLGIVHGIDAFLPLLRASSAKKIIVLGSGAGDPKTALAGSVPNFLAYIMTKAAALVATTKFAVKLRDEGFVVVTFCPGRVDCSATLSAECAPFVVLARFLPHAELGIIVIVRPQGAG